MVHFSFTFNVFRLVSVHLDGAVVGSSMTPLHKTETHEDWAEARWTRNFHGKITFQFTLALRLLVSYKFSVSIQERSHVIL